MAEHAKFTVATKVGVFFCDPHSPWQRGSSENSNGLLRQYLPRAQDFSDLTRADLNKIARVLNNRPRRTLNRQEPAEVFRQNVASTG